MDFRPRNFIASIPSQAPLHVRIWRSILKALHDSRSKEAQSSIRYYRHLYADAQGTGTAQRALMMEQSRPFDVGVAEGALPVSEMERIGNAVPHANATGFPPGQIGGLTTHVAALAKDPPRRDARLRQHH